MLSYAVPDVYDRIFPEKTFTIDLLSFLFFFVFPSSTDFGE